MKNHCQHGSPAQSGPAFQFGCLLARKPLPQAVRGKPALWRKATQATRARDGEGPRAGTVNGGFLRLIHGWDAPL